MLIKKLSIFVIVIILFEGLPVMAADPYQDGAGSAGAITNKYGSKSGIDQYASKPITNNSSMVTVDNSKSFDGHVACPSTSKFLEMMALPSSTGDIGVTVSQKTDLSSSSDTFDYLYTVPVKVSGVCANGFISCDAGTWVNCKYYKWSVDTSMKLGITQAAVTDLGGCYCINNSCGYTLAASNYDLVLSSLGGGAVGSIQASFPQFAISRVTVTSPTATYYGQQASNCTSSPGGSGSGSPQQYYNPQNPTSLENAGQSEVAVQMGQTGSYYSSLDALQTNYSGSRQSSVCSITRGYNVTTEVVSVNKSGTGSMCIVSDISAGVIKRQGTEIYDAQFSATTYGGYPNCPTQSPVNVETFDLTSITLSLPSNAVSPAIFDSVILNGSFSASGCSTTSTTITSVGAMMGVSYCSNQGFHNGTYAYDVTISYKYDTELSTYADTCTQYANDPNCQLKDEMEYDASGNGVYSYRNYNPTGLHVQSSTATRSTSIGTYYKTYQWWKLGRTYVCSGGTAYNFDDARNRSATITSSTSGYSGGSSQSYQDIQCSEGNCISSSQSINLNQSLMPQNTSSCEPACKVKAPIQNTQANASGNVSQYNVSTANYNYFYRACTTGTCPVDASKGESVVLNSDGQECYCTEEFTGVATTLDALNSAGKGMICSSGTKQN